VPLLVSQTVEVNHEEPYPGAVPAIAPFQPAARRAGRRALRPDRVAGPDQRLRLPRPDPDQSRSRPAGRDRIRQRQRLLSDGQDSVSSSLELDGYAGFRGTWGEAVSYDVGLLYYWYPGSYPAGFTDPDTLEGYFSVGWSIFTLKYSHAFTDLFGIDGASGSGYLDLALSQGFAEKWTFDAHVGHQRVDGYSDLDYTDWSLGVTRDLGNGFGVSLAYVDTNADKNFYTNAFGKYVGKATGILTLSKDF
jgi:hypothetical protein